MITNNDFKYDLKVGQQKENQLAEILSNKTIEVKYDKFPNEYFFIEIASKRMRNGKEKLVYSGITTTQSNYYALCKSNLFIIISTKDLKNLIKSLIKQSGLPWMNNMVKGGDMLKSLGMLLSVDEITNYLNNQRIQEEKELFTQIENESRNI